MAALGFRLKAHEAIATFDRRIGAINTLLAARGKQPATDDEIAEMDEAEYLAAFAICENDKMTDSEYPQIDTRPTIMDELTALRQWVCWRYKERPGAKPTKPPINPRTGLGASHSNSEHWTSFDEAWNAVERFGCEGVGFVLTKDDDYVGIDLDHVLNQETGEPLYDWIKNLIDNPETYCEVSPSGEGIRMIARGKIDKAYKLDAAQVEIYADSRYLTITGNFLPQSPLFINEAPRTIEALIARVEYFRQRDAAAKAAQAGQGAAQSAPKANARGSGSNFFRAINDAALRNIPAWLLAIFPHAKQSANGAWRVASKDRGRRDLQEDISVSPDGIKDFGLHDQGDARDGSRTAIDIVMEFHGAPDAQESALWLCERLSIDPASIGWRGGAAQHDEPEYDIEAVKAELHAREKREAENIEAHGNRLSDDLLHPDGVLGEMVDYILSTSRQPIREFAVGAAVATLGTIIGRRVAGPTDSGTLLYIALLAPSAGGKGRAPEAAMQFLRETDIASNGKALRLIGPGAIASAPGLRRHIHDNPLSLSAFDEFGSFLSSISNPRAPQYLKEVSATLRDAWAKPFSYMGSKARADGSDTDAQIKWPAYSIIGASNGDEFFDSLTSRDATNGLLNRFIVFISEDESEYVHRPPGNSNHVPQHVIDRLLELHLCCRGNLADINLRDQLKYQALLNDDNKIVIGWENDDVDMAFEVFSREVFERKNKQNPTAVLYGRVAENAIRLATIHAVSRAGLRASITMRDLEWGQGIALFSARKLVKEAKYRISDNEYQADVNRILHIIKKGGSAGVAARDLQRKLKGNPGGNRFESAMGVARKGQMIIETIEKRADGKGGRAKHVYYINPDYDYDD
jgi:hypothetical protein